MQEDRNSPRATGGIKFNLDVKEEFNLTNHIHQLPCSIKYTGLCSVSDYFKPKMTEIEVDGLRVKEAYYRGRKLQGVSVPFPCGYCGFVLGKKSNVCNGEDYDMPGENSNCWEMKAHSQNITCWNHDVVPSLDDMFLRSFHWFPVAEVCIVMFLPRTKYFMKQLHKPVTADDLASLHTTLEMNGWDMQKAEKLLG